MTARNERIAIADIVLDAVAAACRRERGALGRDTRLADLGMDSLTLISILSYVEALCGARLEPADTLALLGAGDLNDVIAAFERSPRLPFTP